MAYEANVADARGRHKVRTAKERAQATRSAKRHSALVRILRKLLPILAILVLGAYFFSTRMNVHVGGIAASIDGLEVTNGALRMLNPTMRGTDKKNGDYVIKADYADQDVENPSLVKLHAIKADVANKSNGNWSRMRAVRGKFDSKKERLILKDQITLATSAGLTGELSYATIDMKKQILRSHNPVALDLPSGTVRANAMTLYSERNEIVFRGSVAVHLQPRKDTATGPTAKPASAPEAVGDPASAQVETVGATP
jgi:lipopolysaccharide export system protein LptC